MLRGKVSIDTMQDTERINHRFVNSEHQRILIQSSQDSLRSKFHERKQNELNNFTVTLVETQTYFSIHLGNNFSFTNTTST
jgi:hypothetical protein